MANEFVARNGIIAKDNSTITGTLAVSGNITMGGALVATRTWVTGTALTGYATESYVTTAINNLIDSAPGTLDTLNELAAALGDDPNFATTITNSIATKVSKAGDTMTGNINWGTSDRGLTWAMNTDGAYIKFYNTGDGDTNSRLEYGTSDNGNEFHRWMVSTAEEMTLKSDGLRVTDSIWMGGNLVATQSWVTSQNYLTTIPAEYLTQTEGDALYAPISHTHSATDITSGTLAAARLSGNYAINVTGSAATLTTARTLTIGNTGKTFNGSANVSWTLAEIGAYSATNPAGYTTNTGTVTSVSGAGGYGGLTLTGTVTTSGSITLGGTPTGTWPISVSGNSATATTLATARTITLSGAVTGSANFDGSANITITTTATPDPTLTLAGDATGSATFTNLGNATLTVTVVDDSHTHDGRYYTETESDARFVNVTGDTVTGDLTVSGAALGVISTTAGSDAFYVDGVNGRLFTVTDSLDDSLFSVNTVAGLPVIEAFADNTVKLGPFTNPVIISSTGTLSIGGLQAATQSYVDTAITNLIGGAPGALDTLNELAAAINDDASYASTITSALALKAPLASPALTGTPTAPTAATATNSTQIATTAFVKNQGYITGYTETDTLATVTGRGATTGTLITLTKSDVALKAQENGTGTAWRGRIGSFNSTADISSFLGNYNSRAGVFGHNNALTAWADLWVNTLGTAGQGNVYLSWNTYIKGSSSDTNYTLWHSGNDGATSGLDADLLDGNHASAFALSGHNHDGVYLGVSDTAADSNKLGGLAAASYYLASNPSGYITSSSNITGTSAGVVRTVSGTTSAELVRGNMGDNDQARILVGATASNAGYLEIATADDGTEPIYVRQYTGVFTTLTRTATLLDGSGNTSFPGTLTVSGGNSTNWNTAYGWGNHAGLYLGISDTAVDSNKLGGITAASYALLASPALTGTPTAPTATAGTNTTQIATTAFVQTAVSNLIDAAPATLDTLNELAAALGDDPNFATTVSTNIATKVPLSGAATISGMKTFETNFSTQDDWQNSPISILERDGIGIGSTSNIYAPNLNFHWRARQSKSLWLDASGVLRFGEYNASGVPSTDGTIAAATFSGALSGNATTATTLATARTLTVGATGKSFNGSANVSWSLAEIGAYSSAGGNLTGPLTVANRTAISVAHWSAAPSATGAIRIKLPGTHTGNWSMLVLRITAYEYTTNAHTVYYVSGHDWTSGWYSNKVTKIGSSNKSIRLGYDGTANEDYVVLGDVASSWSYGHVTVDVMSHPSFYSGNMDISTGWSISLVTSLTGVTLVTPTEELVWHSQNDGSGSGLDADLLDGNHASAFYLASNPSGYTTNTGTVTSVSGTGGYGGLTLSGTVTTSGNITLGGTPTGTWPISVSGNAATATSATTATSAATWTTARTITIGSTGKSVNGSANVSWTLAEIGAQAAGSYLATTGGNLTGNTSVSSGISFLFSGISDTNWRIGRNIVTESGNQLTSNTLQFIAAAAAGQGWQFVGSTGITRFELDASNGNAWFNGGNVAIGVSTASYKLDVGGQFRASTSSNLVGFIKSTTTGAGISFEDNTTGGNDVISIGASGTNFYIATGYSQRITVDQDGNTLPAGNATQDFGSDSNRWRTIYCQILDSAGLHESNLNQVGIADYETGTVLVWKNGEMVPCDTFADHMRMGIAVHGMNSPLMQGAEPVLCTGDVEEGQYLITSEKLGHAIGVDRSYVVENQLFDCVIGKALESKSGESFVVKTWVNI